MSVRASLVLHGEDKINVETKEYDHSERQYAVIEVGGLCLQIREDALGPFIEKLQRAQAEINGTKEQKCIVVNDDLTDAEVMERLQKNGTAV